MIATEMLKEQKLRKLPVNLKTMVDVLVCTYLYISEKGSGFPLSSPAGSPLHSE